MALRALVTGAGGFLGSHISYYLGKSGYQVAAVGRFNATSAIDTLYPNLLKLCGMTLPDARFVAAVSEFKPDLVVHCAGTASVGDSVHDPYGDFQRTVDVCAFTLETLRTCSPGIHFCLLSSAAVYGNPLHLPISEHDQCKPVSSYGYHKLLCEILADEYAKLHGLKVTVLRVFSAYGERLRKQLIHDLCYKFLLDESPYVELFGSGEESRDFIHAVDVARSIHFLHQNGSDGDL
jgi:UDP-glucose 4-epimerase